MPKLLCKTFSEHDFLQKYGLLNGHRILNAGSSSVRYGSHCVNVDIQQKDNVDVVCDIHQLPFPACDFDAIVCNAVLQYCRDPQKVAHEFHRVLRKGGHLFVDAPWVQPLCPDTPDRFRFSEEALRTIFSDFQLLEVGPSISSGPALAVLGLRIAQNLTRRRHVNYCIGKAASFILYPLRSVKTCDERKTAGAFYIVARKN